MKPRFSGPHGKQARENRHVQTVEKTMPALDEDELMAIVAEHVTPFVLILDCVQDPHNLGAILRTADAAGVHVVVAPKDKAVGITETVRRTMHAHRVVEHPSLEQILAADAWARQEAAGFLAASP